MPVAYYVQTSDPSVFVEVTGRTEENGGRPCRVVDRQDANMPAPHEFALTCPLNARGEEVVREALMRDGFDERPLFSEPVAMRIA